MLLLVSNQNRHTYKYRKKLFNFGLRFESGKWRLRTSETDLINEIYRFCKRKHLHFECIDDRYVRSTDYRKKFISQYEKKNGKYYRCAYCGKRLTERSMTVDHIIPIDKVQHQKSYRRLMKLAGIYDINDIHNLAPACERCNKKKGRELKGYFLKGITGRTYSGVVKRRWIKAVLSICIIAAIVAFLFYMFHTELTGYFTQCIESISNRIRGNLK